MYQNIAVLAALLLFASTSTAQVPDGWYVYGAFSPQRGPVGLFMSHPRNVEQPTTITGLHGDLATSGASAVLYRPSDGAILVGERSPTGASVDLHVIHIEGTAVAWDASFSVGTGGPCCGEIPQMGLLPDGRVVVAATDLTAGPLASYQTTAYGIQGLGIVDTSSGLISVVPIANSAQIVDVFNGLAVAPDASSVYLGTYVSSTQGDIWRVPLPSGGNATLVASVPAGLSNMAFDNDGILWVTLLDASQGLFKVDVSTGVATQVPQTNGSLNAIANESVTGNLAAVSANAGTPPRSVFWMERNGTEHLLANPGFGTISGVAVNPNPEMFGTDTPGTATYSWQLAPNPGGLPLVGSSSFSLTVDATGIPAPGWALIATRRAAAPRTILGAAVHIDVGKIVTGIMLPFPNMTLALPIPNNSALTGLALYAQSFHIEGARLAASPGVEFTLL